MNAPESFDLKLERVIRAPRQKVFEAFTQADVLRRWFGPRALSIASAEVDARVGGRYRITMKARTGETHTVIGEYKIVQPPDRLSFTWGWEAAEMAAMGQTLVTLTFDERGDETHLTLRHTGFPGADARDQHQGGWGSTLNCLVDLVDARGSAATLTVYGDPRSTYTRSVRMGLAEKGLSYALQPESPRGEVIAGLHPFRKIPVFRDGDVTLIESSAILRYIDESFDGPSLLPGNATLRAQMEQWVSAINCYVYPVFVRDYVIQYVFPSGPDGHPNRAVIDAAVPVMAEYLQVFDRVYGRHDYLTGGTCSVADLLLAPIMHYVRAMPEGADLLAKARNVSRAHEVMTTRASFKATATT